jgi:hypothetical protein
LTEVAVEKNSTIIFPLPIDLVAPLTELIRRASGTTALHEAPPTPLVPLESGNGSTHLPD